MIFIDTGAFLARFVAADQYHKQAIKSWQKLEKSKLKVYTSQAVLSETFTLLARRTDYKFAGERAKNILSSESLNILRADSADELLALDYFSKYADQKVSFTDCLSFVLMRKEKLGHVFSYDRHFTLAGFKLWA